MKIKELPNSERPYEKLELFGPEALSNAELLAIILRTGTKNDTSIALAQKLLLYDKNSNGLDFLYNLSLEEMKEIKGIGRVKAIQLKALSELSKRIHNGFYKNNKIIIKSPADVANMFMSELRSQKKEIFRIVLLNTKNHVIRSMDVSIGNLNSSIVHPREVFREAIRASSNSVILVHNHPSGDPEPSCEDIQTTKRLCDCGSMLGITVIDHVIIGDGNFVSLKERGIL